MAACLVLPLALLVCKVYSQECSPPILPPTPPCFPLCLPPPCPPPIVPPCLTPCPPIVNPNPQVTTIIDNTISSALVNALQLLIISNLIGATVAPAVGPQPLLTNFGPLLDCLSCPNPCAPVEVFIPGNICNCAPNFDFIAPCGPITSCGPNFELIPPCCPIIDTFPPPYCGFTEVITPNYFAYDTIPPIFGNCIDMLPPNIYTGYPEPLCPIYGIETICPNFCGGLPNYYPLTEICPNYYGGFAETISPTVAALAPNVFGGFTEVVSPCLPPCLPPCFPNVYGVTDVSPFGSLATLTPNYYGALTEIPLAAEVVFPSAIPAQLTCNFGYTPSSLPCVRVNVEPMPYDPCVCNGYGTPFYY